MTKCAFALAVLILGAAPGVALGHPIDALTLTQLGANTSFAITGTFPFDFPTTPYSTPNTPYVVTFTVPTAPTSFSFIDSVGLFVLDTDVTLNGVAHPNSQVAFFTADLGGGVDVCVLELCSPDPPTVAPRFVVFTNPVELFTGSLELQNPVFIAGRVSVDPDQSFIEAPAPASVPEPASLSLTLLGGGILSLAAFRKRSCRV